MVLSDTSIRRPVLATVFSAVLMIFGLFAFERLTVREYPDIDRPVISIGTTYRGASAPIIETQVTQVVEDAIAGIAGIDTITSTSREESSSVNIEFESSRDIEGAANDVRDRIARAVGRLPEEAEQPRVAKSDSDARPMIWIAVASENMNGLALTDYSERFLVDRLSAVPGVARVMVGGGRRTAMRIWLDPEALAARRLTVQDVEAALRRQNVELPSGRIESVSREVAVRTESALRSAEEFRALIVKQDAGHLIRLGEVAEVALGAEDERSEFRVNGRTAVGIGVVKQSTANTLDVADGVTAEVAALRESVPLGVTLDVSYDRSVFIRQSIEEVFVALGIALVLVVGVIFVFLRSVAATAIPAVAIPISVIASFTVLAALGFSINVLTLLALVLAIGLVVDDAIVVLENIHRRMEAGEPPLLAAMRGSRQIAFAVIATTVVLVAVFVPISFMEGSTGRLFREFGIAVAAAVIFSSFVALTLTPMMCSKLLRPPARAGVLWRVTEVGFSALHRGYAWMLERTLGAPVVVVAVGLAISAASYALFDSLPREFAPAEDRGVAFIPISAPEGASLEYTKRYVIEIEEALSPLVERGDAARVFTILAPGFGRPGAVNAAFSIVRLRDWADRELSQSDIVAEIAPKIMAVPGVRAFALTPPGLGQRFSSAPVEMVLGGPSYEVLADWRDRILAKAREAPGLTSVRSDYEETRPEIKVEIDRDRAGDLGVSVEDIGRTLETLLGSRFVTTFIQGGKEYNVVLQARPEDRASRRDLANIYVRSESSGALVPLSNLARLSEGAGARALERVDRLRSITISAGLAPGTTLGDALATLDGLAETELPAAARVSYAGEAREYRRSSVAMLLTFGLALLVVFLALAAQFESFVHPFIIMLTVPLAVTGALGAMALTGLTLNVYSQIAIIMLVGLQAKNAILIVEFANQLRDKGREVRAAVLEAAVTRLRPILMTTIATAFGALPLALATGAGAEARGTLGIVIIGGIGFATLLSLFVVPVLYNLLARFARPTGYIAKRLTALEAAEEGAGTIPAE